MDYQLHAIRLFAADWPRARNFYRDVLGLPEKFADETMGWAEFDVGSASLALERLAPEEPEHADLVGRFVGVSLRVADINKTYDSLRSRGVEFVAPPVQQSWGGVLAHLKDPEGNVITLLEIR